MKKNLFSRVAFFISMAMLILCIYFFYYSIKHYGRQMEFAAAQRGDLLSLKIYLLLNPGMLRSIDFDGNGLLHCAVRDGHYDMAEYLLARGIGANCTDRKSRTSLHLAAGNGKDDLVKLLLSRGASQSLLDYEGYTPLHRAVEGNHLSTIRLLAGNGEWKEIKLPPRPGSGTPTPLALAVRKNNVAAARLLLDCGFNVNEPYDNGITPLYCATRFAGREMTELLVQRGADLHNHPMIGRRYDLLLAAADSDDVSVAALLIDKGVDVNERDGRLQTPLHYACRNASPSMISLLIERGAEVNARDSKGDTPLHRASCRNSGEAVAMLIKKGTTVNEKNAMGVTPLHYAAKYHALNAAEALVAAGAKIQAGDRNGRTPLTQAISEDDLPMLKLFVEHGADLSGLDECRFRSLNRHKGNNSFEMEEYLIDKGVRFKP